jgi:carbamate kinase
VDLFVISTAVEKVALYYGTPQQRWLDRLTCVEAKNLLAEGIHFAKGSMAPKIQSIIWYLEAVPHGRALITNPENLGRALKGETGTWFVP